MELGEILGWTVRNLCHHFGAVFRRAAVEADATESGRLTPKRKPDMSDNSTNQAQITSTCVNYATLMI